MGTFDFEGGHLALDYANTAEWHASEQPVERLGSYRELIEWSQEAGTLDAGTAGELQARAQANPAQAESAYQGALALRETLYRVFSALTAGGTPPAGDLAQLTRALAASVEHGRLEAAGDGFHWTWPAADALERPLWPIARAAIDLLRSDQLDRVGECADDRGCGYLFLDTSRNHSRRWCSMESCGNRAKARSYYQRAREDEPA
jgi:predicted RNA-binding Zn ribbon-like protein